MKFRENIDILKQWKKQIICVLSGFFLYGLAAAAGQSDDMISGGYLERGDYGDGPKVYDFVVMGLAEEPLDCQAEIQPMQYGEEEAKRVFEQIAQELPDRMKGENESLSMVRFDLELPTSFSEYGVSVSWRSESPDMLDSFGHLQVEDCPKEGTEISLTATLTNNVYEKEVVFPVRIYPKIYTFEETLVSLLQERIEEENRKNPTKRKVELPKEYDGKRLSYQSKKDNDYKWFPVFGFLAAFLLYAREKKKAEEEKKQRKQKLLLDYADVVYQLMVFTGAGLTVGRAWERIVLNYEARRREKRCQERPAYEEMAAAFGQMQCGQPEGKAIMEFGKQCQLQVYLKLTTLLEQNRRTGTKNLQQTLEQEMISAWEQQKNVARRMGEEAGTKLLLPLFLMLFVVMVLVMVPAMMAMA